MEGHGRALAPQRRAGGGAPLTVHSHPSLSSPRKRAFSCAGITADDVVVTAHQLNFMPGCSVIERVRRADLVIWLDETQYEAKSFVNRNRLADGTPMTVPVNAHDHYAPINRVRIADPTFRARAKAAKTLELKLGPAAAPFAAELRRPYELLAGLNQALIETLLAELGIRVAQRFQSMLDRTHALPVWSDTEAQLEPVRERFAAMAAQLGGTVWLSGPGGHHCGEEKFAEHGIRVVTYRHEGANPSAVELVRERLEVAA